MNLKITYKFLLTILIIFLFTEIKSKELGKFNDWSAYAEGEGKNLACLAVSKPKKAEGNYKRRGEIFAVITHLPGQNKWNEFSIVAGYNYKADSNPEITVGDAKFQLFTEFGRCNFHC